MSTATLTRATLLLLSTLLPDAARATSGYAQSRLLFYQYQGNFCPESRDCTGATYKEAEFDSHAPVRHTKVYLRNAANGAILGQGTTDEQGNCTLGWYLSDLTNSVTAQLVWVGEHRDGRFAIRSSSGSQYMWWTPSFVLRAGTTRASPQDLGPWT